MENGSFWSTPLLEIDSPVLMLAYFLFCVVDVMACFANAPASRKTPDFKESFLLLLWLLLGVLGVRMLLESECLEFWDELLIERSLST